MNNNEEQRRSAADRTIERGEMYVHVEHGRVEVTDIWYGTQQVDTPPPPDEQDANTMVIVRYIPATDGDWRDELADTLDEFRDAIE